MAPELASLHERACRHWLTKRVLRHTSFQRHVVHVTRSGGRLGSQSLRARHTRRRPSVLSCLFAPILDLSPGSRRHVAARALSDAPNMDVDEKEYVPPPLSVQQEGALLAVWDHQLFMFPPRRYYPHTHHERRESAPSCDQEVPLVLIRRIHPRRPLVASDILVRRRCARSVSARAGLLPALAEEESDGV